MEFSKFLLESVLLTAVELTRVDKCNRYKVDRFCNFWITKTILLHINTVIVASILASGSLNVLLTYCIKTSASLAPCVT